MDTLTYIQHLTHCIRRILYEFLHVKKSTNSQHWCRKSNFFSALVLCVHRQKVLLPLFQIERNNDKDKIVDGDEKVD